jgi:hypothetical protein
MDLNIQTINQLSGILYLNELEPAIKIQNETILSSNPEILSGFLNELTTSEIQILKLAMETKEIDAVELYNNDRIGSLTGKVRELYSHKFKDYCKKLDLFVNIEYDIFYKINNYLSATIQSLMIGNYNLDLVLATTAERAKVKFGIY